MGRNHYANGVLLASACIRQVIPLDDARDVLLLCSRAYVVYYPTDACSLHEPEYAMQCNLYVRYTL